MRQIETKMRMPLFFKLWFAFVACIAVTLIGATLYLGAMAISAGPEGLGRAIGAVLKGIDDGRK